MLPSTPHQLRYTTRMTTNNSVHLPQRDFYGSRLRCLLLTHQPPKIVAEQLTKLVQPHATVDADNDHWMPAGFPNPNEPELDKDGDFLSKSQQSELSKWWLAVSAKTPTWDLVSTCTIDGKKGLILVEAKAHVAEMSHSGKTAPSDTPNSQKNHDRITAAITESSNALNEVLPGFALSADTHYQLCNRFAWSWKIASLGIPVILVYLGFLNANDMTHRGYETPNSDTAWTNSVHNYAQGVIPTTAWNQTLNINNTLTPIIRSLDMTWLS
jgi:hypothetical protein